MNQPPDVTLTPVCDQHQDMPTTCPWCRVEKLREEDERLREVEESWRSARTVIEAVIQGRLSRAALTEVVDLLDTYLTST